MAEQIGTPQGPSSVVESVDLAQFDSVFASAEAQPHELDPVPDGDYQVNVARVELTRSKASGNPMLTWELRILAPRCEGRRLWRYSLIVTPDNIRWLKTDLHLCGVDLAKLSDLPDQLYRLLDVKLEVTKRTRGEFEDVFFNRRIHSEVDGGSTGDGTGSERPPF